MLADKLDRDIHAPIWSKDDSGVYFQYDDGGKTRIGFVSIEGKAEVLATDLGGEDFGRPYSGGTFSVADDGTMAFTFARPDHPADVGICSRSSSTIHQITHLNENLLGHKTLGQVEQFQFKSGFDGRMVEGWIVKPPHFDSTKKYPLILEIHGGPYANYGERFTAEIQLFAAAGYVVLYTNPRGSTGYGEEFAQLINNKYPGNDYDDLMAGVDAVLAKGYIDNDNLFVTGGSGGGALTAWIVGKTKRFKAAVASKPVINWFSFALTADEYTFFGPYWFGPHPWEKPEEYFKRSPISLVGNVTTPTMLLTGEVDFRTPMSESEQFYQALKLRKIDTALVKIPDASHNIGARPSQMIAKVAHILKWFEKYRKLPDVIEKKDAIKEEKSQMDGNKDLELLAGTWNIDTMGWGDTSVPKELMKGYKFVFAGNKLTWEAAISIMSRGGKITANDGAFPCEFKIDSSKKPKEIDITLHLKQGDRTFLGIYEINGDALKVCYYVSQMGRRPTEFSSKDDRKIGYITLTRAKK